jgi:DNA/RNA-binding domain of Phe-tRNA-synthetase-like protein
MSHYLQIDKKLNLNYPGLSARIKTISGVKVTEKENRLEEYKVEIINKIKKRWKIDDLKEDPVFSAYRDFFWRVKVDPTKNRPASEALIRRILHETPFPKVNTLVDSYNLASAESCIPFAAFDTDKIMGTPVMREAKPGEAFLGIGMEKPLTLSGGEAVIQDSEKLIAVYPYRDADISKVTTKTNSIILMACGVPGIDDQLLKNAENVAASNIFRFCGGSVA